MKNEELFCTFADKYDRSMQDVFHPMSIDAELPERLNNPFDYEPHPLCVEAARLVCDHLKGSQLGEEVMQGKMLGVLICEDEEGQPGFLAAYSGQLGGREDWPWFVPAVFDYLQPDGYFKREEAEISAINHRIKELETSPSLAECRTNLKQRQEEANEAIAAYKQMMVSDKAKRDVQREKIQTPPLTPPLGGEGSGCANEAALIRESQFQKAELRRLKKRWAETIAEAESRLKPQEEMIAALKEERKRRSDALQRWLFDQFVMLNDRGEHRTLTSIFADTPQQVPPSGAGECCAPKLLQYAFLHHLRPVQIAEFWQGCSPRMEVRHHGQYYPACRGKCKPILEWMIQADPPPAPPCREGSNNPIEEKPHWKNYIFPSLQGGAGGESSFLVIDKPAGLLSVPGRTGEESVEHILRHRYQEVYMVHRLDQDTSGLMVVALTQEAYHNLQQQFLARTLYKKYIALVESDGWKKDEGGWKKTGTISLPLRPDPYDRPRQVVDFEHGKEAVTDYEVLGVEKGGIRLALTPHTGRTHQLRMHCAHPQGLGAPIVGDRLYGRFYNKPAQRLCLHAAELAFNHPVTGQRLCFSSLVPF